MATESSHLVPGRVGLLARSWRSLCFLEATVKLEKVLKLEVVSAEASFGGWLALTVVCC